MNRLKIALVQINTTVGDIKGNVAKIKQYYDKAVKQKLDIVVFPEATITGYPPEDLVLRKKFQKMSLDAVKDLYEYTESKHTAMIVGSIFPEQDKLYNSAFVLHDGQVIGIHSKSNLPNYGVFDEKRIFDKGLNATPVEVHGVQLGLLVCEDMRDINLAKSLADQGAEILISLNASPFEFGKQILRKQIAKDSVRATGLPLVYVNLVGGQDELVFDGHSFVINADTTPVVILPPWEENLSIAVFKKNETGKWDSERNLSHVNLYSDELGYVYHALVLGLRDYVSKNNFSGIVIGLSGGIDSALSAAIAVDAIGAERVHCVMMPSKYTSKESLDDAEKCAKLLSVSLENISIKDTFNVMSSQLEGLYGEHFQGLAVENLQARIRGNILMAISNMTGYIVLTTGNKSEMAVGYATLYGDMCGGFSVLKDIYKTDVFALSHWRNDNNTDTMMGVKSIVIPENIITKAPTAELRENQKDSDSLPPYDILDEILEKFIEEGYSSEQIINDGHGEQTVHRIQKLLYRSEYKRRQSPPGVKVSGLSFGKERRYPMTNKYV